VDPKQVVVILHNGRLTHVEDQPGLHWAPLFGREIRAISTAEISYELPLSKVVDAAGVPIVASAVLIYKVVDALKALIDVRSVTSYVQSQASAALKQVVQQYHSNELKTESAAVSEKVVEVLQQKLDAAGVKALSMTLNELNYAPEIASQMLKKQQAAALIEARELIVEGAISISVDAIKKLEQAQLEMTNTDKVKIVANLLTVCCSDENAKPVLSVGG
jgi:regulator of protease activity HflC (stomatin/prohibitin superfamily)